MMGVRVKQKDGKVLIGRVVNSDENQISLMLVGNHVVQIKRDNIESTADEKKSLMYENLLTSLTPEQIDALLDYLIDSGK